MGKTIGIEELKSVQLAMMDDIHQFCQDNGIVYYLAYGTLLGAIRHKGYIPWDDDIDIMMPRPDYEKFIRLYNDRTSSYRMVCMENSSEYDLPFGKVHDTRTVMKESLYKDNGSYGVYIDVFPIDDIPSVSRKNRAYRLRRMINIKKASFGSGRSLSKDLSIALAQVLLWPFSKRFLLRRIESLRSEAGFGKAEMVGYFASMDKGMKSVFRSACLDSAVLSPFEDRQYNIPSGYDEVLRSSFGDYMQLPPVGKRISNHTFEAYWKDQKTC